MKRNHNDFLALILQSKNNYADSLKYSSLIYSTKQNMNFLTNNRSSDLNNEFYHNNLNI